MKKIAFIILFIWIYFVTFSQTDYSQTIAFQYHQISLKDFLEDIHLKYQINFSYGNLDLNQKADCVFQGTLEEGLEKYFSTLSLKFKKEETSVILKKASLKNVKSNIRGLIIDKDSKSPIIGATFIVLNHEPFDGTASNIDGYFSLQDLPIGRYDFKINSIGYESKTLHQIELISAKDLNLEIALKPSVSKIAEVTVFAKHSKYEAINEMAMSSSRSFSVEETQRYAASISDPARMAQNYAGVTHGGSDLNNDIVIRGNSPRGLLWRLEGVEIPNPNHYGATGSKGGGISLLNSTTLNNSDFYTSSFPAQYGNALSGIFDLKLRKGNSAKREHSIKIGLLGLEAATEGYFSKKSKASYLINYRLSSTFIFKQFIEVLKEENLFFQDVSFKVFFPTKKFGTFTLFGLGGINTNFYKPNFNRKQWKTDLDWTDYKENQKMGVVGLNHKIVISKNTYLDSHVALTTKSQKWTIDILDSISTKNSKRVLYTDFKQYNIIVSSSLNHKISSKHLLKIGVISTQKYYEYFLYLNGSKYRKFFNTKGNTNFFQSFLQWKYNVTPKLTMNLGIHFSYLFLNKSYSFDPRFGLNYKLNKKHSFAVFVGLHSKPGHLTTYLLENPTDFGKPNFNLKMTKSLHSVFSYQFKFAKDFNFKTELYYQYLFHVPVIKNANSNISLINAFNVFDVLSQNQDYGNEYVSEGTGENFGLDITLEKYFSKKYYAMLTASLFDSYYTTYVGKKFRTKFANNYLFNILGGKEFVVGKNKNNIISINAKFILNGGNRYIPIDLKKSIEQDNKVYTKNSNYTKQFEPYYRFDLGFKYKINTKNTSHTFMIDIQNVSNHKNIAYIDYNEELKTIVNQNQLGIIPFVSYKLDFSIKKK